MKLLGRFFSIPEYSRVDRTDWQNELFRNAALYQTDLNVSGGTEFANYMFSLGYADQEAIVLGADYSRYTMRLATDFQVGSRVKIGQNFNLSYSNRYEVSRRWKGSYGQQFIAYGTLRSR
jgi:hypothetical protein